MIAGKTLTRLALASTLVTALGTQVAVADDDMYEVTITNLTRGQVITPPVVISHKRGFALFTPTEAASDGLRVLAEDGDPSALVAELESDRRVKQIGVGDGVIPPGHSMTIALTMEDHMRISAVAMLASTNDGFAAVRSMHLKSHHPSYMMAWDAGTENNSENCAYIPGPPCGNPHQRDTDGAEGFVTMHNGIHGIGDLDAATRDWRGPVAMISVRKMR